MQYAYPWYVMFGLMLGAGVVIWFVCRLGDLGLEKLLNTMAARRDHRLNETTLKGSLAAEGLRRMADEMRKLGRHDDRG